MPLPADIVVDRKPRAWPWLVAVLAVAVLLYLPVLHAGFVVDDLPVVRDNPHLRGWGSLGRFFTHGTWANTALQADGAPVYRPILLLSLTVQYALWQDVAGAYHAFALALHLGATAMLFVTLRMLTGATPIVAAIAAALFAWHPTRVESVAWISGQNDPMAALFALGALLAHRRLGEGASRAWLALSLACFALALGSKEAAIALPLALLAHDRLLAPRVQWLPLTCHGGLAAGYMVARGVVLAKADSALSIGPDELRRAGDYLLGYAELLVLPRDVPFHLVPPQAPLGTVQATLSLLVLAAMFTWLLRSSERAVRLQTLFALAWLAAFLWPAVLLSFYKLGYFSARHLYLPAIGLAIGAAVLLQRLAVAQPRARPLWAGVAALTLAGQVVVTRAEIPHWRDDAAIYGEVVRVAPHSAVGHVGLGRFQFEREDYPSARAHFEAALQRAATPEMRVYPLVALGTIAGMAQDIALAESRFNEAVQLSPDATDAWAGLGNLSWMKGRLDDAAFYYEKAYRLSPSDTQTAAKLAAVYDQLGQADRARQLRQRAAGAGRIKPGATESSPARR